MPADCRLKPRFWAGDSSAIANVCSRIFRVDVRSVTTVLWPGHMGDGKLGNVAQSDPRRVTRAAVKATKAREELRQAITLARAWRSPRNPKNLWPEPHSQSKLSDPLENKLKRQVCKHLLTLKKARAAIRLFKNTQG